MKQEGYYFSTKQNNWETYKNGCCPLVAGCGKEDKKRPLGWIQFNVIDPASVPAKIVSRCFTGTL